MFAGDFAQLPPVGGKAISLYSGSIGTQIFSGLSHNGQESSIDKALWNQVTTVVILRENIRQKTQTPADAKFHQGLETKFALKETLHFCTLVLLAQPQIDLSWLEKTPEMYPLLLDGIHKKTKSMNSGRLDLQNKQTNNSWTSIQ